MPRLMQRIARLLAPLVLVALVLGACTGDDGGDGETSGSTANGTGGSGSATGETSLQPVETGASNTTATYEYLNAGLDVTMEIDGETGTMQVDNGTDHEVGKASFYLLDATTGERADGKVSGGSPVEAGDSATFDVSLEEMKIDEIGLVVLLLGKDNYGAFVRTA
jgi:hypothetical protein